MGENKDNETGTLAEQGKHIAHNMAEVFDVSSQIWQRFLAAQMQDGTPMRADPLNTWPTFAELYRTMWDNPKQVADMTIEFWAAQQQLFQNSMLKWLGAKDAVARVVIVGGRDLLLESSGLNLVKTAAGGETGRT